MPDMNDEQHQDTSAGSSRRRRVEFNAEYSVDPSFGRIVEPHRDPAGHIDRFLRERCVMEAGTRTSARELYDAYCEWSQSRQEMPVSQFGLGKRLGDLGVDRMKSGSVRYYVGIFVSQEPSQEGRESGTRPNGARPNCTEATAEASQMGHELGRPQGHGDTDRDAFGTPSGPLGAPSSPSDLSEPSADLCNFQRDADGLEYWTTTNGISRDLYRLTDGWPRRVDGDLFTDDGTGTIRWLPTPASMFAWLKSRSGVKWLDGADADDRSFVTREELHCHLRATAQSYVTVEEAPHQPRVPGVYYACGDPPEMEESEAREVLDELMQWFRPATDADEAVLWAYVLTQFWGGPAGGRPLIVVTGADERHRQQTGKTAAAQLLGGIAAEVFKPRLPKRGQLGGDDLSKQLVSRVGRRRRVALIDNKTGTLDDEEMADLLTAAEIHGRGAFEGQSMRPNTITWVMTTNELAMSADLAGRSIAVRLRKPETYGDWQTRVARWIASRRDDIISAACALLRPQAHRVTIPEALHTRFPVWDTEVLATHPHAIDALRARLDYLAVADFEEDEVAIFESHAESQVDARDAVGVLEVTATQLAQWWCDAIGARTNVPNVARKLRAHIARGRLGWLEPPAAKRSTPSGASRQKWTINISALRHGDSSDQPPEGS